MIGHEPTLPRATNPGTRTLASVLALTATYTVAEAVGGYLANSLALLADAGHMMTDNLAIALALLAGWIGQRPPDRTRTYGYQRIEILAALVNSAALVAVALLIFWEAWRRLQQPVAIDVSLMAGIAAGGLAVNLAAALLLRGSRSLNVRAAYLHLLGDLLGSIGTLVAAALIGAFDWGWADPVVSVVVGGLIVASSWRLVLDSVNVLLESVPSHLDAAAVERCLRDIGGVSGVHDLHLWSLAGGAPLLTAHLVVDHSVPAAQVLRSATAALRERFGITHATLQVEPPDFNIVDELSNDGPGGTSRVHPHPPTR